MSQLLTGDEQVRALDREHGAIQSRGVALRVNPAGTLTLGLSAFPATTAAGYVESLREAEDYRESPPPGDGEPP